MTETNITRRRVVQGAGALGVAGVFGSGLVSAQDGGDGGGQQGSAVRVAHMSPDAPQVDVQIEPVGGGQVGGNETGGGPGANDTGGNGTATEGGGGSDGGVQIEGVGFRDVSSFRTVDPGTYQVRIVPSESGPLGGLLGDLFGGGGDEQTVLYEDQLEVEENTTYTLTAFGEVSQGPVPAQEGDGGLGNETDTGLGDNETDVGLGNETDTGFGDNESGVGLGNETDTGLGGNETAAGPGADAGQGQQLVESLSYGEAQTVEVEPGDYMLRISEAQAADGGDGVTAGGDGLGDNGTDAGLGNDTDVGLADNETDAGLGNETDAGLGGDTDQPGGSDRQRGFQVAVLENDVSDPGDQSARLQVFHAVPDVGPVSISAVSAEAAADGGAQAGNGTNDTAGNATGGLGNATAGNETGGTGGTDQPGVRTVSVTLEANTAYTAFASGYFDPEEAPQPGAGGAGNETGGGIGGNDTVANQTDTPTEGESVAQTPDNPEFELVVVQDAQGGERSDGGTGGGIL